MAEIHNRKRRKVCALCMNKPVDYKSDIIKKYIGETGRILPRRMTGTCLEHQRVIRKEIQRARFIGLIPYVNK